MNRGVLAVFDFDHTICDDNTDVVVRKLLPDKKIPEEVKVLYKSNGWIAYMNKIMELLHENGFDARQIENAIVGISEVAGIEELLVALHANGHEIIIISDSNSVFINRWLKSRKLEHVVSRIFTNPAYYNDVGRMSVNMYHIQNTCQLSTINLCKGQILMDYVNERHKQGRCYERIVYVGDGKNDLCPILRLSQTDLACPRKGYVLIERLNKTRNETTKARVVPWDDGRDLRRNLEQILKLH